MSLVTSDIQEQPRWKKVQQNILASSCELEKKEGTNVYVPTYYLLTVKSGQVSAATIYLQNLNNAKYMAFADKTMWHLLLK